MTNEERTLLTEVAGYLGHLATQLEAMGGGSTAPRDYHDRLVAMLDSSRPDFVVKAYDEFAQATILFWIGRARAAGVNKEKIERAHRHYEELIKYQSAHPDRVKLPD